MHSTNNGVGWETLGFCFVIAAKISGCGTIYIYTVNDQNLRS